MKIKKVPMRTCVVTRQSKPKRELVRVVRNKDMKVSIDLSGKAPGRGAYLSLEKEVVLKAQKNKILDRQLEVEVPITIYQELLKLVNE